MFKNKVSFFSNYTNSFSTNNYISTSCDGTLISIMKDNILITENIEYLKEKRKRKKTTE